MILNRRVFTVFQQTAPLDIVGKFQVNKPQDARPDRLVVDRSGHLDAPFHVARHKVGRGNIHPAPLRRAEHIDARMLQKTADNAHDLDVVRIAGYADAQTADAADDHTDLDAGHRRFDQLVDQILVRQRIDLDGNRSRLALIGKADFTVDITQHRRLHCNRGGNQMLCAVGGIIRQNPHKDTQAVLAEFTVGCHQAQVRILARGALIVVTRTHLRDKARLVADAPRNDQQLGMYLVLTKAIDDVDAGLLKPLGPDNIVFLIEACAQLDDDMDLLAVFRGFDQRGHDLAFARDAVQRHLDRQDRRVVGRLEQQRDERLHAFKRIRQYNIVVLNLRNQRLAGLHHLAVLRDQRRIEKLLQPAPFHLAAQCKAERHIERRHVKKYAVA